MKEGSDAARQIAALMAAMDESAAANILAVLGHRAAQREFEAARAVRFARKLLDAREPRDQIRDRLQQRFGLSRASAYRRISEALQIIGSKQGGF